MAVEEKKKKSLSEVVAQADSLMDQMESSAGADPFAIAAPRPGETRPLESQSVEELTGEQPPTAAPVVDSQPTPTVTTQAPDIWGDYDEIEYEDADTGETFKVRAPKSYASKVKDGYARRSVMDRNSRYLGSAKSVLEPIITSGQFLQIQPLLDRALNDPEYATVIGELYRKRISGEPLTLGQQTQLQQGLAEARVPAPGLDVPPDVDPDAFNDPYVKAIGSLVDRAIDAKLSPFQRELAKTQEYETNRARQEQQAAYAQAEARRVQQELLSEMRYLYPADFSGSEAESSGKLGQLFQYAVQSGYITDYNPNTVKLGVRLAYRELGTTTSPSPAVAAQSAAQVEADARARASAMVAGRTGGGGVVPQAAPLSESQRLAGIKSRKKDGSMKKPQEIANEVARALERA